MTPDMTPDGVEIVRELTDFRGAAVLVKRGDEHFVVSSVDVPYSGPEALAFPADKDGTVTEWLEVAGGRGMSCGQAIAELAAGHDSSGGSAT